MFRTQNNKLYFHITLIISKINDFQVFLKVVHRIADVQMHHTALRIYRVVSISIPDVTGCNSKMMLVIIEAITDWLDIMEGSTTCHVLASTRTRP